MNGYILIDKPCGLSSNAALQKLKRALPEKIKIGHAGTLDPLASGMLIALLGKATRLSRFALLLPKTYAVTLCLGASSDSYDSLGQLTSTADLDGLDHATITRAAQTFVGKHPQTPPIFSALKINGQPAYALARKGQIPHMKPRSSQLFSLNITAIDLPLVHCIAHVASGYYIRSLVHDLGQSLNVGAHLIALHRLSIGPFTCESMQPLDTLCTNPQAVELHPPEALLTLPIVKLDAPQAQRFSRGQKLRLEGQKKGEVQVHQGGQLIGIAQLKSGMLSPTTVLS